MADLFLQGLPGNLALWRLLSLKGIRMPLQALEETVLFDFSLGSMVQELGSRGIDARAVMVQAEDLDHLALPTLVELTSGSWLVLRERVAGGYRIEQGASEVELARTEDLAEHLSGTALDLNEPLPETGGLWSRMLKILPRYRKPFAQALALALIAQVFGLVGPWLTGLALDQALPYAAPNQLQIICLGLVLSALFRAWVGWLKETALLGVTTHFEATVEKGLFDHLLWLPFRHFQNKSLGQLLQSFAGLGRARNLLLNRGLSVGINFATAFMYIVYMGLVMPGPAGLVVGAALVMSLLSFTVGRLQAREQRESVQATQAEYSAMVELLTGVATLKATGCQTWAFHRWAERLRKGLHHTLRADRIGLWAEAGDELLNQGLTVSILIWGGYKVLTGELTLGSLIVFTQLSSGFVAALLALSQAGVSFIAMRPQLAAVEETFKAERQPKPPRRMPHDLPASVVADNVWFRYGPGTPWVVQGVQLDVAPGTFHHLKGPSGSGKSTMLKLLAGLYAPDKGSIALGGMDVHYASGLIVFLPQFPQLHSGSLMENLKLFSGGATYQQIMAVAKDTGLDDWVKGLPMGYQTLVASGGANFSGGQRQLVAISAVLASPKRILLLDEALSSLDWVIRNQILNGPHFKGRTVIYASHEGILPDQPH